MKFITIKEFFGDEIIVNTQNIYLVKTNDRGRIGRKWPEHKVFLVTDREVYFHLTEEEFIRIQTILLNDTEVASKEPHRNKKR